MKILSLPLTLSFQHVQFNGSVCLTGDLHADLVGIHFSLQHWMERAGLNQAPERGGNAGSLPKKKREHHHQR